MLCVCVHVVHACKLHCDLRRLAITIDRMNCFYIKKTTHHKNEIYVILWLWFCCQTHKWNTMHAIDSLCRCFFLSYDKRRRLYLKIEWLGATHIIYYTLWNVIKKGTAHNEFDVLQMGVSKVCAKVKNRICVAFVHISIIISFLFRFPWFSHELYWNIESELYETNIHIWN